MSIAKKVAALVIAFSPLTLAAGTAQANTDTALELLEQGIEGHLALEQSAKIAKIRFDQALANADGTEMPQIPLQIEVIKPLDIELTVQDFQFPQGFANRLDKI